MLIEQKGRFIYFDNLDFEDLEFLKSKLIKEDSDKNRNINFLFYDKDRKQYATYFGYLDYLLPYFSNKYNDLKVIKPKLDTSLKIDEERLRAVSDNIKLRDYQLQVAKRCLIRKIGTCVACVSFGKTYLISSIIKYLNKPSLIIVPTQQLLQQFYKVAVEVFGKDNVSDLSKEGVLKLVNIGIYKTVADIITRKTIDLSPIEVICWDEAHSTEQCETGLVINKYFNHLEYNLGFTGTLYRYDNVEKSIEDFIMLGFTGTPICYVPISFLVKKGYLAKPFIYIQSMPGLNSKYKKWYVVYRKFIENYTVRNKKIVDFTTMFFNRGLKTLVLVNTKRHAKNIFSLLPPDVAEKTILIFGSGVGMAESYGSLKYVKIDYNEFIDNFMYNNDYMNIISTPIFSTGTDIPVLNCLILGYSGKAYTQNIQRIGRVIRKSDNKKYGFIVDFYDRSHYYLQAQSKKRIETYLREGFEICEDFDYFKRLLDEECKRII